MKTFVFSLIISIIFLFLIFGVSWLILSMVEAEYNLPEVEYTDADKRELDLIAAYYEHCDDRYHPSVCGIWAYMKAQEVAR